MEHVPSGPPGGPPPASPLAAASASASTSASPPAQAAQPRPRSLLERLEVLVSHAAVPAGAAPADAPPPLGERLGRQLAARLAGVLSIDQPLADKDVRPLASVALRRFEAVSKKDGKDASDAGEARLRRFVDDFLPPDEAWASPEGASQAQQARARMAQLRAALARVCAAEVQEAIFGANTAPPMSLRQAFKQMGLGAPSDG